MAGKTVKAKTCSAASGVCRQPRLSVGSWTTEGPDERGSDDEGNAMLQLRSHRVR